MWWRMKKVLYGRRKAAQYWTELLASIMTEFSLERSLSAPHLFRTPGAPKDMIFMSSHMDDIHGEGPRKRLEALLAFLQTKLQIKFSHVIGDTEQHEKYEFLRRERVVCNGRLQALLGSCPHSHKSFQSGLRCYVAFAVEVLGLPGRELPPTVASLMAWSTLFRCVGTVPYTHLTPPTTSPF